MKKIKFILASIIFALFILPIATSAHSEGLSIEKVTGPYLIDIGYSSQFITDESIRLDFSILDDMKKDEIPFDSAWVRIEQEGKLYFAGSIAHGEFGEPGFSFIFPKAGNYTLFVRFEEKSKSIAETSVNLHVEQGSSETKSTLPMPLVYSAAGLIIGFMVNKIFFKKNG